MGERAVLFFFSNMCVNGEPKVNVKRKHNRLTARGRADTPKGQTTRTHIYEGVSRNIYPHTKSEATESESVRVPRLVALVQAARRLSGACRAAAQRRRMPIIAPTATPAVATASIESGLEAGASGGGGGGGGLIVPAVPLGLALRALR